MSTATRIAVCPGSFDPLTMGHVDIIERAARLFDRVIVAVLINQEKKPLFSLRRARRDHPRGVRRAAERRGRHLRRPAGRLRAAASTPSVIVRGLRAVSDFEYEFQMALMNRHLSPQIETVFMMPAEQYTYISSRLIKEVFGLGGQVEGLVPPLVEQRLRARRQATPLPHARLT